jgi:hypothetical protein
VRGRRCGVLRVRQYDPAEALEAQGVFEPRNAAHALYALSRLPELQFHRRDAELGNRVLEEAVALVVAVRLEDDVARAAVEATEGFDHLGHERRAGHAMAVHLDPEVLGKDVLADDDRNARQGGSREVLATCQLRHGGQDDRRGAGLRIMASEARRDLRATVDGDIGIRLGAPGAEDPPVDGEVREIEGIVLLRGELYDIDASLSRSRLAGPA